MKKRLFLGLFAVFAVCVSSTPVIICDEVRVAPASKTVAHLVISHDVKPNLPSVELSISFLLPRDKEELNKFQKYGDRADVLASRSAAIKQLVGVIAKKLETRINFSLCFDCGLGEKNVVAQFAFLKNGTLKVGLLTTTQGIPVRFVNLLKAILLDETMIQKHWGKGLVAAGIVVVAFWCAQKSGLLDNFGKPPRRNLSGEDHLPFGDKTFENYFRDYVNNTTKFPYTCEKLSSASPDTDIAPLRAIIGSLDGSGNLKGGMSFEVAEGCHVWIQWAFPTSRKSDHNSKALISTEEFQQQMKSDPQLRNVLLLCFRYYLNFMGLDLVPGCTVDTKQADIKFVQSRSVDFFANRMGNFINRSHNQARIARIITSLRIHGLEEYSKAFYLFLTKKETTGSSCLYAFFKPNQRTGNGLGADYLKYVLDKLAKPSTSKKTHWELAAYPTAQP